jgi:hypothetical protein
VTNKAKTAYVVNMVAIKFHLYSQKIDKTIEGRTVIKSKDCFTFFGNSMIDTYNHSSTKILKSFLAETGEIYDMKSKFRTFYNKMTKIQEVFKNRIKIFTDKESYIKLFFEK